MPAEIRSTSRKRLSNSGEDGTPSPKRSRTSEVDEEETQQVANRQTSEHFNANPDDTHYSEGETGRDSSPPGNDTHTQQESVFDGPLELDASLVPPNVRFSMSEGYPSETDQEASGVAEEPAEFYKVSETLHEINTWSYEVETPNEIYRVSTILADFIGVAAKDEWPARLKKARGIYHQFTDSLKEVQSEYRVTSGRHPDDHEQLYRLKKREANLALQDSAGRRDFLRKWPSAYEAATFTEGHWSRCFKHIYEAEAARVQAVEHFEKARDILAVTGEMLPASFKKPFEISKLMTKRTYAMSPGQYDSFQKRKTEQKNIDRRNVRNPYHYATEENYPRINFPYLPPLKNGLYLPVETEKYLERQGLPQETLDTLGTNI